MHITRYISCTLETLNHWEELRIPTTSFWHLRYTKLHVLGVHVLGLPRKQSLGLWPFLIVGQSFFEPFWENTQIIRKSIDAWWIQVANGKGKCGFQSMSRWQTCKCCPFPNSVTKTMGNRDANWPIKIPATNSPIVHLMRPDFVTKPSWLKKLDFYPKRSIHGIPIIHIVIYINVYCTHVYTYFHNHT